MSTLKIFAKNLVDLFMHRSNRSSIQHFWLNIHRKWFRVQAFCVPSIQIQRPMTTMVRKCQAAATSVAVVVVPAPAAVAAVPASAVTAAPIQVTQQQ